MLLSESYSMAITGELVRIGGNNVFLSHFKDNLLLLNAYTDLGC